MENPHDFSRLVCLSTFFQDGRFEKALERKDFQNYVLGQGEVILQILLKGFALKQRSTEEAQPSPTLQLRQGSHFENKMRVSQTVDIINIPPKSPVVEKPQTQCLDLEKVITDLIAEKTGYPLDMIEPELDLESDLGIDTVKKMELLAELGEKFQLKMNKDLNFNDISSVRRLALLIQRDLDYCQINEASSNPL